MQTDIVERLTEMVANVGRDWRSGEEFLRSGHQSVVDGIREAAKTIATLRREVEQANADCKRANELTNAAIDDYNAAKAELKHARAKALEDAIVAVNALPAMTRPAIEFACHARAADAIRSLADKEG